MSLTITGIPDCKAPLGPSQFLKGYQLQPGTADYPSGGYIIPGSLATGTSVTGGFEGEYAYGAWISAANAAGAQYGVSFLPDSGSFGTTPAPSPHLTMIVTLPGTSAAPGTPLGLGPLSTTSTAIGVASNVITVTMANSFKAGQFVYLQSFTAGGALNGTIVQIVSANATQFTANFPTANITAATADVTGTAQLVQAATGNLLTTGTAATITNSLSTGGTLTITCANTFKVGQFVVLQGMTNGAGANGVIVQVKTVSGTQFTADYHYNTFSTAADAGTATLLVTAGGAPVTTGTAAAITNSLATANSAGTAGVITLTADNSFVPGNIVIISGLTNGAVSNGAIYGVISTNLTNQLFKANGIQAGYTTAADAGTASLLVTGVPTSSPQVAPGTDLSACSWFCEILSGGE
jgi:hypothetical protein